VRAKNVLNTLMMRFAALSGGHQVASRRFRVTPRCSGALAPGSMTGSMSSPRTASGV
jgi:hypothetical protein